jgi:hypothetical protein
LPAAAPQPENNLHAGIGKIIGDRSYTVNFPFLISASISSVYGTRYQPETDKFTPNPLF